MPLPASLQRKTDENQQRCYASACCWICCCPSCLLVGGHLEVWHHGPSNVDYNNPACWHIEACGSISSHVMNQSCRTRPCVLCRGHTHLDELAANADAFQHNEALLLIHFSMR